ncbi:Major facilitator superfamily protein [Planktothrix tepida]|uniref:Major facilitator superfamily protein n=1 Tax=Planktothrix tepida PCC 9214 TaxID=671072 RepID=A0A1J1LVW6_9CYAN|nr:MFS transporter [Planktothrix tepida]CAD5978683.1 Major facilitator superfamily protein [Planktothrix tepida]CUR36116.1 Major facilitator superfamily protein [Planktothrix tepida PCC 9214]
MGFRRNRFLGWLPQLNPQIFILAIGRLLSQTGTGFTLFYAPIFFVNQVGLSSTAVGLSLGLAQISGILGRFLAGSLCDSPRWGRRFTLLISAVISAISSFILAVANDFTGVVLGNLLLGLGIGLYWPATEAVVADLTTGKQRNEAYALTRLGDNVGLQLGIILGGLIISTSGNYRALFIIDGISFIVFFGVIFAAIQETNTTLNQSQTEQKGWGANWWVALRDRTLLIYVIVNIMFTIYISQINSTLPLYFNKFVQGGLSAGVISWLFIGYTAISVIFLLPISRWLNRFSHSQALSISALLWGVGYIVIAWTGMVENQALILASLGLGILAIAVVCYTPASASLVADLAPDSLRGIYLAINAQCWGIGYLIGPPLGGWALDQSPEIVYNFWVSLAFSIIIALFILKILDRKIKLQKQVNLKPDS